MLLQFIKFIEAQISLDISTNILNYVLAFISFYTLSLSIFFYLRKKGKPYSNRLISLLLFLFAFNFFNDFILYSGLNKTLSRNLYFLTFISMSLYAPLLLFYIRSIVTKEELIFKDIVHFIPVIIITVVIIPYLVLPEEEKISVIRFREKFYFNPNWLRYFDYFIIILMFYYWYTIKKHYLSLLVKTSKALKCLRNLNLLFLLYAFCWVFYYVFDVFGKDVYYLSSVGMSTMVLLITRFIFKLPEEFDAIVLKVKIYSKYRNSGLSQITAVDLKERLEDIMKNQRLYLNHDIRLVDIAKILHLSKHNTSQLINEYFEMTFPEFINTYRIEEAELLLKKENHNLSIADIAEQVGFSNKVTFYNAFKKLHDLTPNQYKLKQH